MPAPTPPPEIAATMLALIGREGTWSPIPGFVVDVRVTDVRWTWGRNDLLIVPVSGSGSKWVYSTSVHLKPN